MQIARPTRHQTEGAVWIGRQTDGPGQAGTTSVRWWPANDPCMPGGMNDCEASAIARATGLIAHIERFVAEGALPAASAKRLLGELSSLLARLPKRART